MKINHLLLFVLPFLFLACHSKKNAQENSTVALQDTVVFQPKLRYGINVDSLIIEHKQVKRHEFLGTILEREGVSSKKVLTLAKNYKEVFDVRKIRVGGQYELFHTRDSVPQLAYLVYEKSKAELVIYDFTQKEVKASTWLKKIEIKEEVASGIIHNSLWQTIYDQGANPMLSSELAEIYAWSVDFFGIAAGDRFKVVYEENFVDSTSLGIKKIKYALFKHKGDTYYAIPFEQNGFTGYFNQDGESLKRAFLKAPLRYSRISSNFSNRRYHPVLKIYRAHHGVDYAAPSGTPVHTIGDGTVVARGYQKNGGGNYLKIKHNSVYTTVYMHLKGFASGMRVGARVQQGQTIGYVGATGLATGPHLDFRVYRNGSPMNPLKVKSPPVVPILDVNKAAFSARCDSAIQVLKAIPYYDRNGSVLAEESSDTDDNVIG